MPTGHRIILRDEFFQQQYNFRPLNFAKKTLEIMTLFCNFWVDLRFTFRIYSVFIGFICSIIFVWSRWLKALRVRLGYCVQKESKLLCNSFWTSFTFCEWKDFELCDWEVFVNATRPRLRVLSSNSALFPERCPFGNPQLGRTKSISLSLSNIGIWGLQNLQWALPKTRRSLAYILKKCFLSNWN